MAKKEAVIVLFLLIVLAGCAQQKDIQKEEEKPAFLETAKLCSTLCMNDKDAYCAEERVIEINGTSVSGTCRAFSRKGNVQGFDKCEGFCKGYGKRVFCMVGEQKDTNCDGVPD